MDHLQEYKHRRMLVQGNQDEVEYNIGRTLQLMGLNIGARKVYEAVLSNADTREEIRVRARFNLCQILKGAGLNSGLAITGYAQSLHQMSAETKRDKISDLVRCH
jgi:hypothetical protein